MLNELFSTLYLCTSLESHLSQRFCIGFINQGWQSHGAKTVVLSFFLDMVAFYRKCNVNVLGIIKLLNLITFSKSIILDGWKNQPYWIFGSEWWKPPGSGNRYWRASDESRDLWPVSVLHSMESTVRFRLFYFTIAFEKSFKVTFRQYWYLMNKNIFMDNRPNMIY